MLSIGRSHSRNCQGVSRRSFIQAGASSVLGLSWADWLRANSMAGQPGLAGRAKSVILLWLWGGPSQLDTWDPKPDAPMEYRGPFSTIPTSVPGTRICELFPRIAQLADKYSIIRSLHTQSNDHGVAGTIGLTGSGDGAVGLGGQAKAGTARAALGAMVARARGATSALPPFMVIGGKLHQGKKTIVGEGGGPLGPGYDAFRLEYDPRVGTKIPALDLPDQLNTARLEDRDGLLKQLDHIDRAVDQFSAGLAMDEYRARALAMMLSPDSRQMFDLTREPDETRSRYGRTRFGQSCLLARRLVENGVPFVQVNWSDHVEAEEDAGDGGWDHHYRNFQIMQDRHAQILDRGYAALLNDLAQRGLLDQSLVLAVGEFGRTPKINDKAGRDHWEHCYSALVAGAGIRGGQVLGESDKRAEHPRSYACTPADLAATVQWAVGIDSEMAQSLSIAVDGHVLERLF